MLKPFFDFFPNRKVAPPPPPRSSKNSGYGPIGKGQDFTCTWENPFGESPIHQRPFQYEFRLIKTALVASDLEFGEALQKWANHKETVLMQAHEVLGRDLCLKIFTNFAMCREGGEEKRFENVGPMKYRSRSQVNYRILCITASTNTANRTRAKTAETAKSSADMTSLICGRVHCDIGRSRRFSGSFSLHT